MTSGRPVIAVALLLLEVLLHFAAGPEAVADDTRTSVSQRYVAYAIQGDLRPAADLFAALPPTASDSEVALARLFRRRFLEGTEIPAASSGDQLTDGVIAAYRDYWRAMLMAETDAKTGEAALRLRLAELLSQAGAAAGPDSRTEYMDSLQPVLRERGFGALLDRAPPLLDFFVWRKEDRQRYEVELTDETRQVEVLFLSDFASLGWKDYASLGLTATTGWVEGETLYCVGWAYAPDSENFRVSYLKHETRHLADFDRFPGLPAADLEYRAKLTELAFAVTTLPRLLGDFNSQAAEETDSPHAIANWRVMRALEGELFGQPGAATAREWPGIHPSRVHRAARRLLAEDTARLIGKYQQQAP